MDLQRSNLDNGGEGIIGQEIRYEKIEKNKLSVIEVFHGHFSP